MSIPIGTRIPPFLGKLGMKKVAEFASETGLTVIDLPELAGSTVDLLNRSGLGIGTVDVRGVAQLLSGDAAVRQAAVDSVKEQIQLAAHHEVHVLFMCLVPEDKTQSIRQSLSYFEETFADIVRVCETNGVKIALEGWPGPGPHYATLGYTPEVWRAMFAAVSSPALGLCFDPSHLVRLGIDYLRVLSEFGEKIHHCHGKDTQLLPEARYMYGHLPARLSQVPGFSEGSWRYCIPGEGEVDWRRVAFELANHGYQGAISIELEDARYWGTLEQEQMGIRKAFAHLSECFA